MRTAALPPPGDERSLLARAWPEGPPAALDGLFPASGWLRRVSAEGAVLLGGGAALLLEVAHPLVAAGVAEHSRYREDPFGRLARTLQAVNAMVFGDRAAALAAAQRVARSHERIRGRLHERAGAWPPGTPYHGRDAELVRWVWATLAETALGVYERFHAPLSPGARDAYHAEHAALARVLGVPPDRAPASRSAFEGYLASMLASDRLAVTPAAREVARSVVAPPPSLRMPGSGRLALATAALLPQRLREDYGLAWGAEQEARLERLAASVRALRRG